MSNCIWLGNNVVKFHPWEIDRDKLKSILDNLPKECPDGINLTLESVIGYYAWWFLKENTIFQKNGIVKIRFGEGRSTHTWRDFRGLVNQVIKPLMLCPKIHTFIAKDDGWPGRFQIIADFQGGILSPIT